mgnify:CR=1 FL=1|tara:strand:- start:3444 stop:3929 length:486 start_codon:yes stop_codon:yes gene_type:complete
MIWEYGNYKFNCNLKPPTWDKFNQWKKDFFKLQNINKYEVWLTGGFLENWKTLDVDIVLTGKPNYKELQKLMIDGISLGIKKYNMFVDIQYSNKKPELNGRKVQKIVSANKIVQDGRLITDWTTSEQILPNLYSRITEYPKEHQMNRVYKNKPILLNEGVN